MTGGSWSHFSVVLISIPLEGPTCSKRDGVRYRPIDMGLTSFRLMGGRPTIAMRTLKAKSRFSSNEFRVVGAKPWARNVRHRSVPFPGNLRLRTVLRIGSNISTDQILASLVANKAAVLTTESSMALRSSIDSRHSQSGI